MRNRWCNTLVGLCKMFRLHVDWGLKADTLELLNRFEVVHFTSKLCARIIVAK